MSAALQGCKDMVGSSGGEVCLTEVISLEIGLVRVTIAVMKNHDQCDSGRKGFIWLMLPYHDS